MPKKSGRFAASSANTHENRPKAAIFHAKCPAWRISLGIECPDLGAKGDLATAMGILQMQISVQQMQRRPLQMQCRVLQTQNPIWQMQESFLQMQWFRSSSPP
jgi:hypothetical protein